MCTFDRFYLMNGWVSLGCEAGAVPKLHLSLQKYIFCQKKANLQIKMETQHKIYFWTEPVKKLEHQMKNIIVSKA